ncbi:MAG: hypothetical protein ACOYVK_15590 [Bacillota bacterium]
MKLKKMLVLFLVTILVSNGLGIIASAVQDPHPWSIKYDISDPNTKR